MKVVFTVNGKEAGEEATLYEEGNRYEVILKTKSLYITSIQPEDASLYYSQLFSDPRVMKLFGSGKTLSKEEVDGFVSRRTQQWNSKNPFSAFSVFKKNHDGTKGNFIGSAMLTETKLPGEAELSALTAYDYWNEHFGTEGAMVIVNLFAHELAKRKHPINNKPFTTVMATARPDNPGSWGILERKLKMTFEGLEKKEQFGADQPARKVYRRRFASSSL